MAQPLLNAAVQPGPAMKLKFLFIFLLAAPTLLRLLTGGAGPATPPADAPAAARPAAPAEPAKANPSAAPKPSDDSPAPADRRPTESDRQNQR